MFKKLASLFLCLILVIGLMPVYTVSANAEAATGGSTGDCTWSLEGTVLTISGNGKMADFSSVSDNTSTWGRAITEIVISEGVTSIGDYAFYNCTALNSVTIPSSLTHIGLDAFKGCSKLTKVYLTDIAKWCAVSFESLYSSPLLYGKNLYTNGSLTRTLEIPSGVTKISDYAFYNCTSITSVTIPSSVTHIGLYAFDSCSSLSAVHITDLTKWCEISFANKFANPIYMAMNLYLNGSLVTDLVVPSDVTRINAYAFYNCHSLESLTIPSSVKSIESSAFSDCGFIKTVNIQNGVESIGNNAFYNCYAINSLTLPSSVKSIGDYAFYYCMNLTDLTIPNGVQSIGDRAFCQCYALAKVSIPQSVKSIGAYAFINCSKLTEVHINDVSKWCEISFENNISNPLNIAKNLYLDGSLVTDLVIPGSVTKISDYAFYNCTSLKSVTIPNSVTSIGASSFKYCSKLVIKCFEGSYASDYCEDHSISYELLDWSDSYTYTQADGEITITGFTGNMTDIVVPSVIDSLPVTTIGEGAFALNDTLTSIVMQEGIQNISKNAFASCSKLTGITLPHSIQSISDGAFSGSENLTVMCWESSYAHTYCSENSVKYELISDYSDYYQWEEENGEVIITKYIGSQTEIIVPSKIDGKTVTKIGNSAFADCVWPKSITIKDNIISIGDNAFSNCENLKYITLPGSITSIGESAFSNSIHLYHVYIDDIANWCEISFANKYSNPLCHGENLYLNGSLVTDLVVPNGVTKISDYAFYNCFPLTSVTLPDSIKSIGDYAFSDSSLLKTIAIQNGVESIGNNAFYNCYALTDLQLPSSIKSIGNNAFYNCYAITDLILPNGVQSIGDTAFAWCNELTSITIPQSVKSIGASAFIGCQNLTEVHVNDISKWCEISFANNISNPLNIAKNLYLNGSLVTDLVVPSGTTKIGAYAFYNCTPILSVTIPDSVTDIGNYAFYDTGYYKNSSNWENGALYIGKNLIAVKTTVSGTFTVKPETAVIAEMAFENCADIQYVVIPSNVTSIGKTAFSGCDGVTVVCSKNTYAQTYCEENSINYELLLHFTYTIENGEATITSYTGNAAVVIIPSDIEGAPVTKIGQKAFYSNRTITSITIPGSVKTIQANAFKGCSALSEITFNEGLESIGTYAFGGTKLQKIVFPDSLRTIGVSAFNGVTTLTDIDLANVTAIKGTAFAGCTALGTGNATNYIAIPETLTELGAGAFQNCTSIARVDWYAAALTSGAAGNKNTPAFMGCTGIRTVNVMNTAQRLPSFMFYKAAKPSAKAGITALTFKGTSKVISIGDRAFYQARMGKINLPASVKSIGKESFRNINLLTQLTLGNSLEKIGQSAFSNCNNLASVTIPGNVKTIYAYAFRDCAKLSTVTIEEGVNVISSYAFKGTALTSINLPYSLTLINAGICHLCEEATIYYYEGSYAENYLNSDKALLTGQTLSSLGVYSPEE